MVLPLLGILGAAAGMYMRQPFLNREARLRGEYNQGVTAGVDPNDPNAMRAALFAGGLLGGPDVQSDVRQGFEGQAGRDAAMARQRVASGPGYMNARLAAQKYQDQMQMLQDQQAKQAAWVQTHGDVQQRRIYGDPNTPDSVRNDIARQLGAQVVPYDPTLNPENIDQLYLAEQQRLAQQPVEQNQALLAAQDAAAPYQETISAADAVLTNLTEFARAPFNLNTAEGGAFRDDLRRNAVQLRYDWQNAVYGDREPPPAVQEEFAELFRNPDQMFQNPERTARFFRMIRAEAEKARQYDYTRALVERNMLPASALQGMQRLLTTAERQAILRGTGGVALPEGPTKPGRAPRSGGSEDEPQPSPGSGPGRGRQ